MIVIVDHGARWAATKEQGSIDKSEYHLVCITYGAALVQPWACTEHVDSSTQFSCRRRNVVAGSDVYTSGAVILPEA